MPLSDTLRQANHDLWERTVTHPFVQEMGVSPEEYQSAQVLPTGMAMASFMLVTAYDGTFDDIVTALLVTEWTYRDWATRLAQADKKPPQKMYREWIDIHAAQELGDFVAALRRHVDDAIPADAQPRIQEVFRSALGYEYLFWEMAYHGEA